MKKRSSHPRQRRHSSRLGGGEEGAGDASGNVNIRTKAEESKPKKWVFFALCFKCSVFDGTVKENQGLGE